MSTRIRSAANTITHDNFAASTSTPTAGTSISDYSPTETNTGTDLQINLDGDGFQTISIASEVTGGAIAADIQAAVQALTPNFPANAASFAAFTAAWTTVYTLTSGSTGSSSSVVIESALSNDTAAELKLGVANGGTEAAGENAGEEKTLPSQCTSLVIQNMDNTDNLEVSFDDGLLFKSILPLESLSIDVDNLASYKVKSSANTPNAEALYISEN